jgi:hypothetical protein
VRLGDRVERAVAQEDDLRLAGHRLEARLGEHFPGGNEELGAARSRTGAAAGLLPQALAEGVRGAVEGVGGADRPGGARVEGIGEQARRDVVATGRERQLELALRALVQLRGAAGARARPAGQPAERDLEEPGVDQPVEVEGRQRAADPDSRGGGVTRTATSSMVSF